MKMKLAQRIVLGYYKTKINTLIKVAPGKAAQAAFKLFCTPYSGKRKLEAPAIFHKADKIQFSLDGLNINGFSWKAQTPTDKTVLIVHGFDSYSYRFEAYIPLLHTAGYNVLAFDAPAHGISDGKYINAPLYKKMLSEINTRYGSLYGIMAHSFGGLAAALLVEELHDEKLKLVLIAPATETITAINGFFKQLGLLQSFKPAFTKFIEDYAGKPMSWFSTTRAVQNIKGPVLWLHDEEDRICPYADTATIRQSHLPNLTFVTTKGLGHSKIYREKNMVKKIVGFFEG